MKIAPVANATTSPRRRQKCPVEVTRLVRMVSLSRELLDIQFFIDRDRFEFHTTYIWL